MIIDSEQSHINNDMINLTTENKPTIATITNIKIKTNDSQNSFLIGSIILSNLLNQKIIMTTTELLLKYDINSNTLIKINQ